MNLVVDGVVYARQHVGGINTFHGAVLPRLATRHDVTVYLLVPRKGIGVPPTQAVSLTLQRAGEKVTGMATWEKGMSGQGGNGGPLVGSVSGNTFSFQVPSVNFRGEAVVKGDDMRGSLDGPFSWQLWLRRQK